MLNRVFNNIIVLFILSKVTYSFTYTRPLIHLLNKYFDCQLSAFADYSEYCNKHNGHGSSAFRCLMMLKYFLNLYKTELVYGKVFFSA